MTTRDHAPQGAPCWVDLSTSDVEGSRRFYAELFGWEALAPSEEFGGYFMFSRDGEPIAGAYGPMGDDAATDSWTVYVTGADAAKTVATAEGAGAQVVAPVMPIADLGSQAVLVDPTGAVIGVWQPDTFPGFLTLDEPGSPSWFELHTRDHAASLAFYREVFGWDLELTEDTDEFRYATLRNPEGEGELAGVMDASGYLPAGEPAKWSVYWEVADASASTARVVELGGAVVEDAVETPYGVIASVRDPAGAAFRLRTAP